MRLILDSSIYCATVIIILLLILARIAVKKLLIHLPLIIVIAASNYGLHASPLMMWFKLRFCIKQPTLMHMHIANCNSAVEYIEMQYDCQISSFNLFMLFPLIHLGKNQAGTNMAIKNNCEVNDTLTI